MSWGGTRLLRVLPSCKHAASTQSWGGGTVLSAADSVRRGHPDTAGHGTDAVEPGARPPCPPVAEHRGLHAGRLRAVGSMQLARALSDKKLSTADLEEGILSAQAILDVETSQP